ncbi:MAG TPA: hypothetical protein VKC34_16680 [Blastocatellia bacterium]|nr:hypothetical protein [Blastocatellia bacterium]
MGSRLTGEAATVDEAGHAPAAQLKSHTFEYDAPMVRAISTAMAVSFFVARIRRRF